MSLNRRSLLLQVGAATLLRPTLVWADTPKKLLVVHLLGGLDGLATVMVPSDPSWTALRGTVPQGAFDLGRGFALHPSLRGIHELFASKQCTFFPATATPYRGMSHIEAADVLATLGTTPFSQTGGWLARLHTALPNGALWGVGQRMPASLWGADADLHQVRLATDLAPDLRDRLLQLYAADPSLLAVLTQDAQAEHPRLEALGHAWTPVQMGNLGRQWGTWVAGDTGPTISAIELGGFDTLIQQETRLPHQLELLDTLIRELRGGLDSTWKDTVVLVVSEFGRSVRLNALRGTNPGTGGLAMLLGGGIPGGQVLGTWPGLRTLYNGRDLLPTTDLRSIVLRVLMDHFHLPQGTATRVIPGAPPWATALA